MLILLSPAKTLDESPLSLNKQSQPRLLDGSRELVKNLKKKSVADIQELMSVSEKIAYLNVQRYRSFATPFTAENAKPAGFLFKGDVYTGLELNELSTKELEFANRHIRILSGLYGLLRLFDLAQPYRLEMGTRLPVGKKKNLYEFWGNQITELLNEDLAESGTDIVLNLASNEYFKAVNTDLLDGKLVDVDFKENRNGVYKTISFSAKKARGRMAHLIAKEQMTNLEALKSLVVNDYVFNSELSSDNHLVYTID